MFKIKYKIKSLRHGVLTGEIESEYSLNLAKDGEKALRMLERDSASLVHEVLEFECRKK